MSKYPVSVLPVGPFDQSFSYLSEEPLDIGEVVSVPFGKRTVVGAVVDEPCNTDIALKDVSLRHGMKIPTVSLKFIDWVARYNMYSRGRVLKMVLAEMSLFNKKPIQTIECNEQIGYSEIQLSDKQQEAYQFIIENSDKPVLLHGVTGSGKTEVYLKVAQDILKSNKQVLLLFPEISLTQQMITRIKKYFNIEPLIWNSEQTKKERKRILRYVNSGHPCLVIGSRSALFLPFSNLGLIVVDEEHDGSYKQEEQVIYNGRDMAVVRAKLGEIPLILSSATPSLETYTNAKMGRYGCVQLASRFGPSQMPYVEIIDLKRSRNNTLISDQLKNHISTTLNDNEQVMLYINRRGYAPITVCKECGAKMECPNCSALLINYKSKSKLMCNHCGHWCDIKQKCIQCDSENFMTFGAGVEKLYDEVTQIFPNANVVIASSDTMNTLENARNVIDSIRSKKADIIIATQILAKGHHFKDLTCVGIIDGDFGLDMADIRASEKTFQLLNQVIGRAGREEKLGKTFIQTFEPKNIIFDMVKHNAINSFLEYEMHCRQDAAIPPFCRMIALIISGNNSELVEKAAKDIASHRIKDVVVLGPVPAPLMKLRGRTRWRILLKAPKNIDIQSATFAWLNVAKVSKSVSIQIDVDPINFL